jgi:hypothetical protein
VVANTEPSTPTKIIASPSVAPVVAKKRRLPRHARPLGTSSAESMNSGDSYCAAIQLGLCVDSFHFHLTEKTIDRAKPLSAFGVDLYVLVVAEPDS